MSPGFLSLPYRNIQRPPELTLTNLNTSELWKIAIMLAPDNNSSERNLEPFRRRTLLEKKSNES